MDHKPGRELDALVAEKVMGWKPPRYEDYESLRGLGISIVDIMDRERIPKPYSTDIAAAWEVVEKLKVLMNIFNDFEIEISSSSEFRNEWEVSVKWYDDEQGYGPFYLTADTAPEAICLAALKSVGAI